MKKYLFTFLFLIGIIGVFAGIFFHVKWFEYLCKPLIMISITGQFLLNSKNYDKVLVRLALIAFLFSLFGDSFLMFSSRGESFFMLGLASFLIAQFSYIFLLRHTIIISGAKSFLSKNSIYLIAYIFYGFSIYAILFNQLDFVMKIAVFVYMLSLMGMSVMALNRYKTVPSKSFSFVFTGSVLFVISDTLIALDKFLIQIPNDRLFVMSTYIAAQYLIMYGILGQFEKVPVR